MSIAVRSTRSRDRRPHDTHAPARSTRARRVVRRQRRRGALRPAGAGPGIGVPVPHRRRTDQRHRDRHRRQRPVRLRTPQGRLPRLSRTASCSRSRTSTASACRSASGIVLDTSGSMDGEKMAAAKMALEPLSARPARPRTTRCFSTGSTTRRSWCTSGRPTGSACSDALGRLQPRGGTAMYDAVAEAIPLAQAGRHRKKALVIISDGNDTSSRTAIQELKRTDSRDRGARVCDRDRRAAHDRALPAPSPPGRDRAAGAAAAAGAVSVPASRRHARTAASAERRASRRAPAARHRAAQPATPASRPDDRVNVAALRDITDDSGGRTEVIRTVRDLDPATAGIADELSQAVLPGLRVHRREGRPVARDPGGGARRRVSRARAPGLRRDAVNVSTAG